MVDIFEHLDYRKFLKDLYAERKAESKNFSYRTVAAECGLKSIGFFTWVLQGKRNLSPRLIVKFAQVFRLKKKETQYFEILVNYNQAKTHDVKKYYFDQLAAMTRSMAKVIDPNQHEFYEKWYYSAIREAIELKPINENYTDLASLLVPQISSNDARKAVELLEKLKLVKRNPDGVLIKTSPSITTGEEWQSLAVHNYQLSSIDLAKNALDSFPKTERDISTLTLSCSKQTYQEILNKVKEFRQSLIRIVEKDEHVEGVYQCNFQVFPLTKQESINENS